jgi:RHS repeat-associated protein
MPTTTMQGDFIYDYSSSFVHSSVLRGSRFTGKERDQESGLDYFGARYFASSMGRFMSPDWDSDPDAVPYADYENPQSLNLYGYVQNNPLSVTDSDGHCGNSSSYMSTFDGNVIQSGGESDGPCISTTINGILNGIGNAGSRLAQTVTQAVHQVANVINTPGGAGCMASLVGTGAAVGLASGVEVGSVGLAGGPAVGAVTMTGAGLINSIGGAGTGVALAMTACPGGAANGGGGGGRGALQKGGNSISKATANALNKATGKNLSPREWGRAVEELKQSEGLPPNSHGTIMSNGDYISANGANLGNLTHYLP